jgi:hypothetical protein
MRKLFAFITLSILFLCAAPLSAFASFAAPEGKLTAVYINAPEDWNDPCVWAWDDDGVNAFAAWPGGETQSDGANPGWVYCYIPSWVTHVIVNADGGSVQTGDLTVEAGTPVWITVASPEEAVVSDQKQTEGETPEYVEMFAVHARVPEDWEGPGLWAWSHPDGTNAFSAWPGKPLKESGDGGWFTATAPVGINSVIINADGGSVQTADLEIDARELWIDITDAETVEVSYDDPDKRAENITVRAKVPGDWQEPGLWAWSHPDGTNVFSSWPGEPLAENGDWFEIEIPGWINRVIVNANGGTVQTADIEVEQGTDIWIEVTSGDDYSLAYEAPAEEPVEPEPPQPEEPVETVPEEPEQTEEPEQAPEPTPTPEPTKEPDPTPAPEPTPQPETPEASEPAAAPVAPAAETSGGINPAIIIAAVIAAAVVIAGIIFAAVRKKK